MRPLPPGNAACECWTFAAYVTNTAKASVRGVRIGRIIRAWRGGRNLLRCRPRCRNAPVLDIRVLGPLEVLHDGRDVTPRRNKERALLAVLALRPGAPVSAARLADELWRESPPRTARHALENYVSELRRRLGREVIETRPGGYALDVNPDQIDLVRFETRLAAALHETPAQRVATLEAALSLLRGDPL